MADNSQIYKYTGLSIKLYKSELKDRTPTKYYVGNFTAGKYPNKDVLTKLEEQQSTYKIVDIDGNEPVDIYINNETNQICIQWESIAPGTYYIEMNKNMFNTVCIEIIDDPIIEQPVEYIPILLQEA